MIGKSALLVAALCAAFLVGPVATTAAADPYSPSVSTSCRVSVPADVEPGERLVIRVSVAANSPTPPEGRIALSVRRGGDSVWTRNVQYDGGTERVRGPVLNAEASYRVVARFAPSTAAFAGCTGQIGFSVDNAGTNDDDGDGDGDSDGAGGLLPDTGGPALLWLVLGVALLGAGGAAVVYARRRQVPAV